MPVYNAEKYLKEAIDSILNQSFTDFEFIIIDDGSVDGSLNIIKAYDDPRIKLFCNEQNKGLVYTLNKGLRLSKGKYVARMDSDDICVKDRLKLQVTFLEKNSSISILGGSLQYLGTEYHKHFPLDNEKIKILLLQRTAFVHPCIMFRRCDLVNHSLFYDVDYEYAEDYHLWTTASIRGLKMANLDDILIYYRQHDNQISTAKLDSQIQITNEIRNNYWSYFFHNYLTYKEIISINDINSMSLYNKILLFNKIIKLNIKYRFFDIGLFNIQIYILLYKNVQQTKLTIKLIAKCLKSNLYRGLYYTLFKIYIKQISY